MIKSYDVSLGMRMTRDHDRIDALIQAVEAALEYGPEEARDLVERLQEAIDTHIDWEEELLFPMLTVTYRTSSPRAVETLIVDHMRLRDAVADLRFLVEAEDSEEATRALRSLRAFFDRHNRDEARGVYSDADRALTDDERRRLLSSYAAWREN